MLLDSCCSRAKILRLTVQWGTGEFRTKDELLVAGGDEIQRPVRCEAAEGQPRFAAKRRRRQPGQGAEPRAERAEALVAHREANVGDALGVTQQQFLRFLNAPPRDEFVRSFSKRARKQTIEMKSR